MLTALRAIKRAFDSDAARPSESVAKAVPSVAVLPFANMSADADNQYFSDDWRRS
jgi:TolB-like protein